MINQELQNKLREQYNPDGSKLRCMQLRMLEMLRFVDNVCKKNNISYWLSSGTCLGAVRHGGFIPWDDDCDIEMLEKDYKRFIDIVSSNTTSPYRIQTRNNDSGYFLTFAKLRDLKSEIIEENAYHKTIYKYNGIYIDVFPMQPSNSRRLFDLTSKLFFHFYIKDARISGSLFKRGWNFVFMNFIIAPLGYLNKVGTHKRLRHKIPGGFPWERYINEIFPLQRIAFEGIDLPVPNDFDTYLKRIYGDYMQLPNLKKLHFHMAKFNIW